MGEDGDIAIVAGGCFWITQALLSRRERLVAEDVIADVGVNGYWPGKVVTKISAAGPFWEAPTEDQNFFAAHRHYAFS